MGDSKKPGKTKKPSGFTITRKGMKFTLEWKINAKNSNDGQALRYKHNKSPKWAKKSLKKKATKASVSISGSVYPLTKVTMEVQNNQDKDKDNKNIKDLKASKWAGKSFKFKKPPASIARMSLSGEAENVCIVSYGHEKDDFTDSDHIGYIHTEYQTTFHSEKGKDKWSSTKILKPQSGSFSVREKSVNIDTLKNLGYVRKYRFRIKGKAGYNTSWSKAEVCSHYYAKPKTAAINKATAKQSGGKINCLVEWRSPDPKYNPIDYTYVQYCFTVPGSGMSCPADVSWTTRPSIKDNPSSSYTKYLVTRKNKKGKKVKKWVRYKDLTKKEKAKLKKNKKALKKKTVKTGYDQDVFEIDKTISNDQVIFVRVVNVHDNKYANSAPKLVSGVKGKLKPPTGFSVNINLGTLRGEFTATNTSDVPDSRIAIGITRIDKKGKALSYIIGVISNSTAQPLTLGLPNLNNFKDYSFFAYAYQGTATYETKTYTYGGQSHSYRIYTLKKNMRSNTVKQGGDVPSAPTINANVSRENTALVTWDWPWASANYSELSWSDHEDAWESTDQPETYRISNLNAGSWSICGLDLGVTWYIRVRLIKVTDEGETPGPWSDIYPLDMTTAPNKPVLSCSKTNVKYDETFTLSWVYESVDGSPQARATLRSATLDEDGNVVHGKDIPVKIKTATSIDLTPEDLNWTTGEQYGFIINVVSKSGHISEEWSDPVFIAVADPVECEITSTSLVNIKSYDEYTDELERDVKYYTLEGTAIENPSETDIFNYYELEDGVFDLTDDTFLEPDKTYYSVSGTSFKRYVYSKTTDIEIDPEKTYYDVSGELVDVPVVEDLPVYYEIGYKLYSETLDIIINDDKTYYSRSGSGIPLDPYIYEQLDYPEYVLTSDTEVIEDKEYYSREETEDDSIFTLVDDIDPSDNPHDLGYYEIITNPSEHNYYEFICDIYELTSDTSIVEGKEYYSVVGVPVEDPDVSDINKYYISTDLVDPLNPEKYYIFVENDVLRELPLTINANITGGISDKYFANIYIDRASSYFVDRPDETTYSGYENENVFAASAVENASSITIQQSDLIGYLDDTARYRFYMDVFDEIGQTDSCIPIEFTVNWAHQAATPTATAEFDPEYSVVKITPSIDPLRYQEGDTFDIYRLSVDRPVLIVKGGTFGQTYVDPFPTIGKYGGHRVVTVTANGDFISNEEDGDMAWIDLDADDNDIFEHDFSIINSGEGMFEILYNADLSTNWTKDFRETRYLGGHIQGDWNAGIHRDSTINSVVIRDDDPEAVRAFRKLAEYPGVCHIRTIDGSNYYADVQVSESIPYDDNPLNSYSFKITRVDSEGYDGIELSEWNKIIGAV